MIIKTNKTTHGIDRLPLEVVGIFNILFKGKIEGFENAYMVEIKLDDPIKHIEEGGDSFIIHQSLDQYQSHAQHIGDYDWAIIHKNMFVNIGEVDEKRFETLLKNYLETGKISKKNDD